MRNFSDCRNTIYKSGKKLELPFTVTDPACFAKDRLAPRLLDCAAGISRGSGQPARAARVLDPAGRYATLART